LDILESKLQPSDLQFAVGEMLIDDHIVLISPDNFKGRKFSSPKIDPKEKTPASQTSDFELAIEYDCSSLTLEQSI
jgi:hypothetical protein